MAEYSGPTKKPRLENNQPSTSAATADEWGDDFAIPVDQLQKLDFITSQAFSQVGPQKTPLLKHSASTSSLWNQRRFSLSGEKENNKGTISLEEFYAPVDRTKKLYNYRPNQYPQSKSSVTSLSGFARDIGEADESQLKSENVSNISQNSKPLNSVEAKNVAISNELWIKGQETLNKLIKKQEEELENYKEQLKTHQNNAYARTGEVKTLRELLSKSELELTKEKQQHLRSLEMWKQEKLLATGESKKKIETLQTELQFKSQELKEVQSKCQLLELRDHEFFKVKTLDFKTPSVENNNALKQPLQRNYVNSLSPKKSRNFPKCEDWNKSKLSTSDVSVQTEEVKVTQNVLPLKCPKGQLSGPKIIAQLFHDITNETDAVNMGLMPLVRQNNLKEKSLRTSASSWNSLPASERKNPNVSTNHLFALSGISRLLLSNSVDTDKIKSIVVTFFPVIEETISRYVFLLTEQQKMKSKTATCERTSLSSNYASLLHSNGVNWFEIEKTLFSSLKLLTKLIDLLPGTADLILSNGNNTFFVKTDKEIPLSTLLGCCASKPSQFSSGPQNLVPLLQLLISTNLDVKATVIEACLEVFYALILTASKPSASSLQNFLFPTLFGTLICNRENANVVVSSLQTATCLMNIPEISCAWLQTHDDSTCPFTLLGKLGQETFISFSGSRILIIHEMFSFLSVLFCQRDIKSCLHDAEESSCLTDLISGLVEALAQVAAIYKQSRSVKDLNIIRSGITTLHQLSLLDSHFIKHRSVVQRQYVLSINQISRLWKHVKDELNPWEVVAIQELNEFSLDESEEFVSKQDCSSSNMDIE